MSVGLIIYDEKGNPIINMVGNYPKIIGVTIIDSSQELGFINYDIPKGCEKIYFYVHEQKTDKRLAVREISILESSNGLVWKKEPRYYHHTLEDMTIKIYYGYY